MPERPPWFRIRKKEIRLTWHFREPDPRSNLISSVISLVIVLLCGVFLIYRSLAGTQPNGLMALFYLLFIVLCISGIWPVLRSSIKRYREERRNNRLPPP